MKVIIAIAGIALVSAVVVFMYSLAATAKDDKD